MDKKLHQQLSELGHALLRMCALAESMIEHAARMLSKRDASAAKSIAEHEDKVNRLQVEIDELCLDMIALHQPTARDLRFIMGASKTTSDLERLADQAVNISQKAGPLMTAPDMELAPAIQRMAQLALAQLHDSLHAFVNGNAPKARQVLGRDDEIDRMKRDLTDRIVAIIGGNPALTPQAMSAMMIAHDLERIGDHSTNIAENTIFVVEGRDVRHNRDGEASAPG